MYNGGKKYFPTSYLNDVFKNSNLQSSRLLIKCVTSIFIWPFYAIPNRFPMQQIQINNIQSSKFNYCFRETLGLVLPARGLCSPLSPAERRRLSCQLVSHTASANISHLQASPCQCHHMAPVIMGRWGWGWSPAPHIMATTEISNDKHNDWSTSIICMVTFIEFRMSYHLSMP